MFCDEHGIEHNFSTPRTPQQNGVVERKSRYLEEIARTLLNDTPLPIHIAFVQPDNVEIFRHLHSSRSNQKEIYNFSTRNKAGNVFAKNWFSEDSS